MSFNLPADTAAANFVFSFSTEAAPTVNSTTPTNGATQVAANTDLTITFSEPVNVTGNWFQIVGATSGTRNVADTVVTGGPTTFTINPNTDFTNGESITVTVFAAQVTDQEANDPPENMASDFAFSFTNDQAPAATATTPPTTRNGTRHVPSSDVINTCMISGVTIAPSDAPLCSRPLPIDRSRASRSSRVVRIARAVNVRDVPGGIRRRVKDFVSGGIREVVQERRNANFVECAVQAAVIESCGNTGEVLCC
jgi:methionine-rich copper-binding protein CopC